MTPEARVLLGEKLEQLKEFADGQTVFLNAKDLRSFGIPVEQDIPDNRPQPTTVGTLREIAQAESVEHVIEDCGCPEKE